MSRTGNRPAERPEFTIVDLRSGRGLGGHCFDYLLALKAAFASRPIAVIAPFVGPDAAPNNRLNVYVRGFFAYRKAIAGRGIGIVHNSSLNDYFCLAAAALTVWPPRRGFCLMMLYRDPSIESFGAGGPALNRATIWLISRLIRSGVLRPASDSPLVLTHWLEKTGAPAGAVVPTPPLPTDDSEGGGVEIPPHDGPLVVIPGRMRAEKGAANYPAVARAVLKAFPGGAIAIQAEAEGDTAAVAALAQLRSEFADAPRVALIEHHLTGSQYGELMTAADIAVLPYDTGAYGSGSSGVVGDALGSGASVVASPIEWIELEHGDDPRVVIVDDPGSVEALVTALRQAADAGGGAGPAEDRVSSFSERWNTAVDEALAARGGR